MAKPNRPKAPAKPMLGFSQLTLEEKIQEAKNILDTAAAGTTLATLPAVKAAHAALQQAVHDAEASVQGRNKAKLMLSTAESDVATHDVTLTTVANSYSHNVDSACQGDATKIKALGLNTAAPKVMLKTVPNVPSDIVAKPGADLGTVELTLTKPKGSKSILVHYCTDPLSEAGWKHALVTTKARATITGLPSGKLVWIRLKSVGSQGEGGWSVPVAVTPH